MLLSRQPDAFDLPKRVGRCGADLAYRPIRRVPPVARLLLRPERAGLADAERVCALRDDLLLLVGQDDLRR